MSHARTSTQSHSGNSVVPAQAPRKRQRADGTVSEEVGHERVRQLLRYDEDTGKFFWRRSGREAGFLTCNGRYYGIGIDRVTYRSSRLAWLYVHGHWPIHTIDHIDGDRLNDSISNLRDVSTRENNCNLERHRNGYLPGTCFTPGKQIGRPWWSRIKVNGRCRSLGYWETQQQAHDRYVSEIIRLGLL